MTPRSSPLGCVPLQSPAPSPGPAEGSAVLGFTFATEPKETGTHSFLLPKPGAVMNSHHGFPKPQHPEHLPEQAGAFPKPCPSQPMSWRHSVPQLYSGKMFPQPKTASAEQDHRPWSQTAIAPRSSCEAGKGSLLCSQRSPGRPPRPRESVQTSSLCFHQAVLDTGKSTSCDVRICGWENVQKSQERSGGKESREFSQGLARPLRGQLGCLVASRLGHSH